MGLGTEAEELPCWWPTKFALRCLLPCPQRRESSLLDTGMHTKSICLKVIFLYNVPGKNVGDYWSFFVI